MNSSSNNLNPSPQQCGSQNRVSLDGGGGDDETLRNRKRKQDDLDSNESSSSESDSDEDNTAAAAPTDVNKQIPLIVTEGLSSEDVGTVATNTKLLAHLLSSHVNDNHEEDRMAAFRCGAHLAIVQAMRRGQNADSFEIQDSACRALLRMSLCTLDNFTQDIIGVGALKSCIQALERFPDNPYKYLHGSVCSLVGDWWRWKRPNSDLRKVVVEEGGLKTVAKSMNTHKECEVVQRMGCYALSSLLSPPHVESSTWAKAAVDAGSITLVIAAMGNHPNYGELQEYACDFLIRLSEAHEDYRSMILDAKGLIPIVEALRIHKDNKDVAAVARAANSAIIGA